MINNLLSALFNFYCVFIKILLIVFLLFLDCHYVHGHTCQRLLLFQHRR